ncbi:hypothetical protein HYZ98_02315 [Candidatus Peregrinibacteria bacterium]|nr:hypothetical protein [Candidatus Peregrinibacteria bacterium]
MLRTFTSLLIASFLLILFPAAVFAQEQENDLSPEQIVQECERRTGFKATDRAARVFIFRRCIQTIQDEKSNKERAKVKATHRTNLQQRATATFDRRGMGDRTILRRVRPQRSTGVQRVYTDQTKFQSIQFNRGRAPDLPESPEDEQIQRAKVNTSQDRYQLQKLAESCPNLSGFRKDLCIRSRLQQGSPRRWTKESRQRE